MQQLGLKTEVRTVHLFYCFHLYVTVRLFALFMLVSLIHLPYIDSHNFFLFYAATGLEDSSEDDASVLPLPFIWKTFVKFMFVLSILYVWNKIIAYRRPLSFETCYFLSTTIKLLWWQLLCWDIIVVDINIHYSLFILWILHVFTTVPSAVKYIKIREVLCELLLKKIEKNARPSPQHVLVSPSLSSPTGDYNRRFGARRGNQAQQGRIDAAHRRGSNQRSSMQRRELSI